MPERLAPRPQVRARGQYSGYHSACRATVLRSFSQGASWETQMCSDGLTPGSSSRVATLNIRYRRSGCSDRMWEPQVAQKRRNLPGDNSYAFRLSSPEIQRNRSRGIPAAEVKAVAWALRQVTQWRWRIGKSIASISYWTVPHKQLPLRTHFTSSQFATTERRAKWSLAT